MDTIPRHRRGGSVSPDGVAGGRRAAYRALCEAEATIPLFSRAWWLDAVCGRDAWDVALVATGDRLDAALPYHERRGGRFRYIAMPLLTQTAGPWLRPSAARYSRRLAREKDLLNELIDRLEAQARFDRFVQHFHHGVTNWLPFYWRGYSQATRYTYVLEDLSDPEALWANTQSNIRREIRKAKHRNRLSIRNMEDVQELIRLNTLTYARQGKALPYDTTLVRALDDACRERACRRILLAEDADGRAHAAVYLVWDESAAYYLIAGADPELRNSGAQSLLAWEAIRFAATVTQSFDFAGSMLEPIERFMRAFGTRQIPYFSVSKTNSVLLEVRFALERVEEAAKRKLSTMRGS